MFAPRCYYSSKEAGGRLSELLWVTTSPPMVSGSPQTCFHDPVQPQEESSRGCPAFPTMLAPVSQLQNRDGSAAKSRWILNHTYSIQTCLCFHGAASWSGGAEISNFKCLLGHCSALSERTQGFVLPSQWAGGTLRSDTSQSQEISLTQRAKPAKEREGGREAGNIRQERKRGDNQLHEHKHPELVQRKSRHHLASI